MSCRPCRFVAPVLLVAILGSPSAHAEFMVKSPAVEQGEVEIGMAGSITTAKRAEKQNEYSQVFGAAYGVTDWWQVEMEGELEREAGPGNPRRWKATTFASKVQLLGRAEWGVKGALFAQYSQSRTATGADSVKFGPLIRKTLGPTTVTANGFLEMPLGPHAGHGAEASYAVQWRYDLLEILSPAVEAYGILGDVDGMRNPRNQDQRMGPVLLGAIGLGGAGELRYELGTLFGANTVTPDRTWKWALEYQVGF
jgi:hypothetical protein